MAALFLRCESMCRSKQFTDAFKSPPENHRANGGFQSSTVSHSLNQTRFFACSAQKREGSSRAVKMDLSSRIPGLIEIFNFPLSSYIGEGVDTALEEGLIVF